MRTSDDTEEYLVTFTAAQTIPLVRRASCRLKETLFSSKHVGIGIPFADVIDAKVSAFIQGRFVLPQADLSNGRDWKGPGVPLDLYEM